MSTFVETSKLRKRNVENPLKICFQNDGKSLTKSWKNVIESLPQFCRHFFHSSVLIFTYLAPISGHFSSFSLQICSRIGPDALFWPPLGSSWPHLGHPSDPLGPTLAPLGSLLPYQDTSWSQSWQFGTPKSHFGRIFHDHSYQKNRALYIYWFIRGHA